MIIGICGAIQGGKSTSAKFLQKHIPNSNLYSFADALKEECAKLFPIDKFQFGWNGFDWTGDKTALGRRILEDFGAEKRKENKDYWINIIKDKIKSDNSQISIIQDVRHFNELEYVKENGFVVYVSREVKEDEFINSITSGKVPHCSETEWRFWCLKNINVFKLLPNNGSLDKLEKVIKGYLVPEVTRCFEVPVSEE